jgi:hypothetical protein
MATTTKKPAPAKKAAKTAAPTHRTDYKADTRVKFTSRTGAVLSARTTGNIVKKQTGPFIEINVGDKKSPVLKMARPAQLKGY